MLKHHPQQSFSKINKCILYGGHTVMGFISEIRTKNNKKKIYFQKVRIILQPFKSKKTFISFVKLFL